MLKRCRSFNRFEIYAVLQTIQNGIQFYSEVRRKIRIEFVIFLDQSISDI